MVLHCCVRSIIAVYDRVNPRAITGPPKMSLLLEAKSMPALILKPRFILVTHTDDLCWYIMSNQQGKMFVQNLNRIVRKPDVTPRQFPYCTTDSIPIDLMFHETFPLTHKFGTAWAIKMTADREGWSELSIGATTATRTKSGTPVIRRSSVQPRAWVVPTTNWSQPETVAKSEATTPWLFVVVEPNHSWWWPLKSPTNRKEARTSSASTEAIAASKKSKIGHLGQGCDKDFTHKGSVAHHKP